MTDDLHLPGSVADLAQAVRETLVAMSNGVRIYRYVGALYSQRKARSAASRLAALGFVPDGMMEQLIEIATGNATSKDIETLSQSLEESADRVEDNIRRLRAYRGRFREEMGLEKTLSLYDDVIYSRIGKTGIRQGIYELVCLGRESSKNNDHIRLRATELLDGIKAFNKKLSRLHDSILPPSKRRSKAKP